MGWNLNNLSFSYLERVALCAHLISVPSCQHLKRRRIALLPSKRMLLAFARIYLICISGQTTYSTIMETCRYRGYILTSGGVFTADQKRHALRASYSFLTSLRILFRAFSFFSKTDLKTVITCQVMPSND